MVRASEASLVVPAGARIRVDDELWPDAKQIGEPLAVEVRCLAGAATVVGAGDAATAVNS